MSRKSQSSNKPHTVIASGERSVAAGGNIGAVCTGDNATVTTDNVTNAPTHVIANGERSVAAGGNIGAVCTGDNATVTTNGRRRWFWRRRGQ